MRLSELSGKEIVDLQRAERMGVLGHADLEIDERDGKVQALIIPVGKWGGFKRGQQEVRVEWGRIKKVGQDMIIFDLANYSDPV
ncbi:YlmC/YmxH family sporulation protein [Bacillus sp. AFS018417]|uniref:YlmC/YmxH family sporulation protein n=1 Tax=unclassified Bacillus (in: firmicutes) TaxID=185979 RepID=UPI000BF46AAF|nr:MULTISPECIES: YlmC/YmxH family sporulation protein [unclassified Bacillus (in: firmicutes)]MCP1124717.1 YlmC/YmxH family sporulation protein [Bacillus sp. 3103sda1]PEZ05438.1 YlmC/YmxH family sporulation protein [Bacillus sp. AFS018417]